MSESTMTPVLDAIVAEVKETQSLDLAGYPAEVVVEATREAFHVASQALDESFAAMTTLAILLSDLENRLVPVPEAEAEAGD